MIKIAELALLLGLASCGVSATSGRNDDVTLQTDDVERRNSVVKRSDDVSSLETIVAQQSQLIEQQEAELQALKAQVDVVNNQLQDFKAQSDINSQPIAFRACLANSVDLSSDPRLLFNNVGLNVGQGYRTGTHSFVAPVTGLYVLSFKVIGGNSIRFGMMQEGSLIAETETADSDSSDRAFVQTLQQLTAGDSVWVQKFAGGSNQVVGGGVDTCFFGHLIHRG